MTVPDLGDVPSHPEQAILCQTDWDNITLALSGVGVLTGCAVTAQASPNMTVAVASGTVQPSWGGTAAAVSSGNLTIGTAHNTYTRRDAIAVSTAGTKSVVAGTAAATPVLPDLAGKILIAEVTVPANVTTITSAYIVDKRQLIIVQPTSLAFNGLIGKTADETSTSTTPHNDTELTLSGLTQGWYWVEATLLYARTVGSSNTINIGWVSSDGSATLSWATAMGSAQDISAIGDVITLTPAGSAANRIAVPYGLLKLTTTASFGLRWAVTSGSDTLCIRKGSVLRVQKHLAAP